MQTLLWPTDMRTTSATFGADPQFYEQLGQKGHNGVDIPVPHGTPVYAAGGGTVAFEGWGDNDNWMGEPAGICVRVRHEWGYTGYAHLDCTVVDAGDWVAEGQLIGYSGQTGFSTGPHLHFEEFPLSPNFKNGYAGRIDPLRKPVRYRGDSTPTHTKGDDDMIVTIQGETGKRKGGAYLLANGVATYLGSGVTGPVPHFNAGTEALRNLASKYSGINF